MDELSIEPPNRPDWVSPATLSRLMPRHAGKFDGIAGPLAKQSIRWLKTLIMVIWRLDQQYPGLHDALWSNMLLKIIIPAILFQAQLFNERCSFSCVFREFKLRHDYARKVERDRATGRQDLLRMDVRHHHVDCTRPAIYEGPEIDVWSDYHCAETEKVSQIGNGLFNAQWTSHFVEIACGRAREWNDERAKRIWKRRYSERTEMPLSRQQLLIFYRPCTVPLPESEQ